MAEIRKIGRLDGFSILLPVAYSHDDPPVPGGYRGDGGPQIIGRRFTVACASCGTTNGRGAYTSSGAMCERCYSAAMYPPTTDGIAYAETEQRPPLTEADVYAFLVEQRSEEGEHAERTAKRFVRAFAGRRVEG